MNQSSLKLRRTGKLLLIILAIVPVALQGRTVYPSAETARVNCYVEDEYRSFPDDLMKYLGSIESVVIQPYRYNEDWDNLPSGLRAQGFERRYEEVGSPVAGSKALQDCKDAFGGQVKDSDKIVASYCPSLMDTPKSFGHTLYLLRI